MQKKLLKTFSENMEEANELDQEEDKEDVFKEMSNEMGLWLIRGKLFIKIIQHKYFLKIIT